MGEQTTITVQPETLERFTTLKSSLNDAQEGPDHTNETFLKALMDTWDASESGYYDDGGCDASGLSDEIRKLREQVEHVPQGTADELQGRFR